MNTNLIPLGWVQPNIMLFLDKPNNGAGSVTQVVERLTSKYIALCLKASTAIEKVVET
jgi:hypothetical protein